MDNSYSTYRRGCSDIFLEHSVEWSMVTVCPYYIISEILNGTRMEILVSGIKQRVRVIQNVCGNGWRWAY